MAETPDVANPPEAIDVDLVLRRNYLRMVKDFVLRMAIVAALVVAGGAFEEWSPWDSPLMGVFIAPSGFVFIFTAYRFLFGVRIIKCKGVLRHYPLEFRPRVVKKSEDWTKYGDVFTVRVADDKPGYAPLLRAAKAVGGRRWPKGTEGGVWVAGDVPFGGVIVVPGTNEMLFFQPARWEKLAPEREQAGAERIERAKRARLLRKSV
ncbi:hypothetical protein [Streptomyces sp. 8N706]|uniref:hypothetical protein n=1 Tax=Streptomyces sp. 8N706 TaxID=3457416 RepID=UPI003FD0F3F6